MMKRFFLLGVAVCAAMHCLAQGIGIGTASPHASAQLDITGTDKGVLIPRMSTAAIASISSPAKGLMLYDSTKNQLMVNMGSAAVPDWQTIVFKSGWNTTGNTNTDTAVNFIGTRDNKPLRIKVNNQQAGWVDSATYNLSLGYKSLLSLNSGVKNVALGSFALQNNNFGSDNVAVGDSAGFTGGGSSNVIIGSRAGIRNTGSWSTIIGYEAGINNSAAGNVFIGSAAGEKNTFAAGNTFIGDNSGLYNTTGQGNSFMGSFSGRLNTTGYSNVGMGASAMANNSTGFYNTAVGSYSLGGNSTGIRNTAIGSDALAANSIGNYNTAVGNVALRVNGVGSSNVAMGYQSMYANTSGGFNTGIGVNTLFSNTSASNNTAVGNEALFYNTTGTNNTAQGFWALRANATGSQNTALGAHAGNNTGTNPVNFTALGYNAGHVGSGSNSIEIGNTSVSWIGGMVGWSTYFSDSRAKKNIRDNVPGINFITKLRPVTYNLNLQKQHELIGFSDSSEWQGKYDIEKQTQSGFIAQEVEQAAKELNYDFNGVAAPNGSRKLYSMQYAAFVVPLVKAVQEQQEIIQAQKNEIEALKKRLDKMELLISK